MTPSGGEGSIGSVLASATAAIEAAAVPYAVIGGLAAALYAGPRPTGDVDVMVREADADAVLDALDAHGFATEKPERMGWLYKARRNDVLVDLIFRVGEHIVLDDEMLARTREHDVLGTRVRVVAPEDFVVMQAVAHGRDTPHYWVNALDTLAANEVDWDYLLRRAQHGARRVLSLLVYAQSEDLVLPPDVVRKLYELVNGSA